MFAWIRGRQFAAPEAPLRDHWVTVNVRLLEPLQIEGAEDAAIGYFRILGLRCTPLRLQSLVTELVTDGEVMWPDTHWNLVDPNQLSRSTRREIDPRPEECAWHISGCSFYCRDDDEPGVG